MPALIVVLGPGLQDHMEGALVISNIPLRLPRQVTLDIVPAFWAAFLRHRLQLLPQRLQSVRITLFRPTIKASRTPSTAIQTQTAERSPHKVMLAETLLSANLTAMLCKDAVHGSGAHIQTVVGFAMRSKLHRRQRSRLEMLGMLPASRLAVSAAQALLARLRL